MKKTDVYRVNLGHRSYDIHLQSGSLKNLGEAVRGLFPDAERCMVISNDIVAPLYLDVVKQSLEASSWQVFQHILPDGEHYKTIQTWSGIMDALMNARLSRNEPIVALGGGVVGDMTGFAAACYRRGVPFVQVPTTVLAQVDSSVGGKTAVSHAHGKNMIGAFYQPRLVWIDPDVLQTL
jgi:3-dehydroquinate synthase